MNSIKGYTEQSPAKLAVVNVNKIVEENILRVLDELEARADVDQRWLSIGRRQIEQGFMAVNRAVMQPQRIALPEDAEGCE